MRTFFGLSPVQALTSGLSFATTAALGCAAHDDAKPGAPLGHGPGHPQGLGAAHRAWASRSQPRVRRADAAACLAASDERPINAALARGGAGARVALCQGASFALKAPVAFTAANQSLFTQGLPTGATRATLRVTGSDQTIAVRGDCGSCDDVALHHVQVDGNRPGLGRLDPGGALLEFGGPTRGQVIDHVHAYEPRAWSTLHVIEGVRNCREARVTNNQIGPAGNYENAAWADGISMACTNSLVENNTITDATDGAVVLFGAPGTLVRGNHVLQRNRTLLGAFNLVDYGPYDGNDVGLVVENNVVEARGGFIKTGVAVGPAVWGEDDTSFIRGATVRGNLFTGTAMGYGIVINGAHNVTVQHNDANATFAGKLAEGCLQPLNAAPAPFLYNPARTTGALQRDFVATDRLQYVICVAPGFSDTLRYAVGQLSLRQGGAIALAGITVGLSRQGDVQVRNDAGALLWHTNTQRNCTAGCQLRLDGAGRLVLQGDGRTTRWPTYQRAPGNHSVLTLSNQAPYLSLVNPAGNLVYGGSYMFADLRLNGGQYLARDVNRTALVLRLEDDANLRLRRGGVGGKVLWSSGVSGASCDDDCFTSLQGDGNLVTYVHGEAVWATGTNGRGYTVAGLELATQAPYLRLRDTAKAVRWHS